MPKLPKPPEHLSDDSKSLWTCILDTWPIDDGAHLAILAAGLEARDRAARCRIQIDDEGESLLDRFERKFGGRL